jgi:hypothetical protein
MNLRTEAFAMAKNENPAPKRGRIRACGHIRPTVYALSFSLKGKPKCISKIKSCGLFAAR